MIKVQFHLNDDGLVRGFQIKGHAGYADHGYDIVCAAVSALAQTAILGLTKVAGLPARLESRDGFLECRLDDPVGIDRQAVVRAEDRAQAILQTLILGLTDIQKEYGQYLSIKSP